MKKTFAVLFALVIMLTLIFPAPASAKTIDFPAEFHMAGAKFVNGNITSFNVAADIECTIKGTPGNWVVSPLSGTITIDGTPYDVKVKPLGRGEAYSGANGEYNAWHIDCSLEIDNAKFEGNVYTNQGYGGLGWSTGYLPGDVVAAMLNIQAVVGDDIIELYFWQ